MQLSILQNGSGEAMKAIVHGIALSLVAVMGAYNASAWLQRRQRHLAFNAVIYTALVFFEYQHVIHHRSALVAATAATAATAAAAAASAATAATATTLAA